MKLTNHTVLIMLAATLGAATSCTDRNDWNTVQEDSNASADQTLWQNIVGEPQLSDFTQVLNRVNLSETLGASHFYTIWAPLNGTFNADSVLSCTDKAIQEQFVKNHIAEYNHPATGQLAERIKTLNKKSYNFLLQNGSYTYNDVQLATAADGTPLYNLPSSNGTLHMLQGMSEFLPNGFESLSMLNDISQIAGYLNQYNDTTLDLNNSVAGPIVNGRQTYLDSVFTVRNTMTNRLRARIESEDSTYSILLPNDDAYTKYYNTAKQYYKYLADFQWQNVHEATTSSNYTTTKITSALIGGVDFSFLSDSIAKRAIVDNLFYSNNNKYNMHLIDPEKPNFNDTIVTTYGGKFTNGDEIFSPEHIVAKEKLSNGYAYVVDTLAFKPWETYNPEITIPGTANCRIINEQSKTNVRLSEEYINKDLVSFKEGVLPSLSFAWAKASDRGKPEMDFYLTGARSTTYNVYVVIPPANIDLRDSTTAVKPNILNFEYNGYYKNEKGSSVYGKISIENPKYDKDNPGVVEGSYNKTTGKYTNLKNIDFVNDTSKVDTIFLMQISLPYSYANLGYYPNIKITNSSSINVLKADILNSYTRDIRVCAIILRPLDYEEYLNPGEAEEQTAQE